MGRSRGDESSLGAGGGLVLASRYSEGIKNRRGEGIPTGVTELAAEWLKFNGNAVLLRLVEVFMLLVRIETCLDHSFCFYIEIKNKNLKREKTLSNPNFY